MKFFLPLWVMGVVSGMIITLWFFWLGVILAGTLLGIGVLKIFCKEIVNNGMHLGLVKAFIKDLFRL